MEKWELAYQDYLNKMKYKDIAEKYDVSINTVKSWKSRKWNAPPEKKVAHKTKKVAHKKEVPEAVEALNDNNELNDQQKMFCLYYLQSFNATQSYLKAYQCSYSTAMVEGHRSLRNPKIKKELDRLKEELQSEQYFTIEDIIKNYAKQAFSDITDFVEVKTGKYYVYQKDEHGDRKRVINEFTGEEEVYTSSSVNLKDSDMIDGTLIQEVKKGKDGVSIKLYDKQKAMTELMKYLKGDELRQAQINKLNKSMEVDNRTEDKLKDYFEALGAEIDGVE